MTTAAKGASAQIIDRSIASRINPIISPLWTEDTLASVADVVFEMGYLISDTELQRDSLFHVFSAIAAALQWESENMFSLEQSRKQSRIQGEQA